jgi:hypothetical protein
MGDIPFTRVLRWPLVARYSLSGFNSVVQPGCSTNSATPIIPEFAPHADSTGTTAVGAGVMSTPCPQSSPLGEPAPSPLHRPRFAGRRMFGRTGLNGVDGANNREEES